MKKTLYPLAFFFLTGILFLACKGNGQTMDTVSVSPEDLSKKATLLIKEGLQRAMDDSGSIEDTGLVLVQPGLVRLVYQQRDFSPSWSSGQNWLPEADSLFHFIHNARLFGLFPEEYHAGELTIIRDRIMADSLGKGDRKDAKWWATADLLYTDAFTRLVKDVKLGRLPQDSVSLRKDSVLKDEFYLSRFNEIKQKGIAGVFRSLEPSARGYQLLKAAIPNFLAGADYKIYTRIPYPEKDQQRFNQFLQKRLYEEGLIGFDSIPADSARLASAVKLFQKKKGITVDGRAGEGTVRMLNLDDREKFARIAISLDKYKQLPEKMPSKYIWVNTSANYMEVVDGNEVKFSSKVISGKAKTRTPLLTSAVSALITYPQWVPPLSIILKEILPAVKKNPGYLAKKGFSLVDKDGNEVDPYSVNWSQYSKGIPYRVVQGSGDANALGIMKFVFDNKYSVYLHDTNQRYLFANAMRSLSHGCVRVQEWEKLAWYLLRNDSSQAGTRIDSVKSWLKSKQKKTIVLRNKLPVFIRYFTCEGQKGNVVFYDDVYGEDKSLRERFFGNK
ncbi:MAG: L,D-transpeptidase family protein [Sphingobacteriales bacterium]|nr:L,D-transpeptidase family protein [Sphingobacteriales bacterium]